MKRDENQNEIFAWITKERETNEGRKGLVLARIACRYEDVQNYTRSKIFDANELKERVKELKEYIKTLCAKYNVSLSEVDAYFMRNKFSMNF